MASKMLFCVTSKYMAFWRIVVPSSLSGSPTIGLLYISRNSFLIGTANWFRLSASMYVWCKIQGPQWFCWRLKSSRYYTVNWHIATSVSKDVNMNSESGSPRFGLLHPLFCLCYEKRYASGTLLSCPEVSPPHTHTHTISSDNPVTLTLYH